MVFLLLLSSCAKKSGRAESGETDFSSLAFNESVPLSFATEFRIDRSEGFSLVTIKNGGKFLLAPQGGDQKKVRNVPDGIVQIKKPLENVYLVSSSVMDFVSKIGAMDSIRFTGTRKKDWQIQDAAQAMESGKVLYAGKYSAPDYELLLSNGCGAAIENTMIFHKPEVKEKLEEIGIPVIVERSIYEKNPLGKLEWIKLYGELFGKEKEAEEFFEGEIRKIEPVLSTRHTESGRKRIAFFYVTSTGAVNVRKSGDYISNLIALSGGEYALEKLRSGEENALSTMNMTFEDFYSAAVDSDIIIYNGNIAGEIGSIGELSRINPMFMDFKAVKEGNAYSTGKDFFQESTGLAQFLSELYKIQNGDDSNLSYLKKLEK